MRKWEHFQRGWNVGALWGLSICLAIQGETIWPLHHGWGWFEIAASWVVLVLASLFSIRGKLQAFLERE